MSFMCKFVLLTLCLSLAFVDGQLVYSSPYAVPAHLQQQLKLPLPYNYQFGVAGNMPTFSLEIRACSPGNNNEVSFITQQQPYLVQQPSYVSGQGYNLPYAGIQQIGYAPQYQPGVFPQPAVVEQIEEVVVPNPTKVVSAAVETPILEDDSADIQAVLAGLMTQAELQGQNVHAEEYYYARGEPLVVSPALRRVNLRNPLNRGPNMKKPFTVKKNKHFELYKYQ